MPKELEKIKTLIARGLSETASLWPPIERLYRWIAKAACLLRNDLELCGARLRRKYAGLLGSLARLRKRLGPLAPAADHFLKVTRSYWKNLFYCYDLKDLPRTNNELEQTFGSFRFAQRRATGRKSASRSEVISGPARIAASLHARLRPFTAQELAAADIGRWRKLRQQIDALRQQRNAGRRFRKNPERYLTLLGERAIKLTLPS